MNHISQYLATSNATQRGRVIRSAKFPKKVEVAAYSQVRDAIKKSLFKADFGRDDLDFLADRMDAKARTETGWHESEALRSAQAVRAFQQTFDPKAFKRYTISAAPKSLSVEISGVKLNVTMDAAITQVHKGVTYSGGLILKYAFGADRSTVDKELSNAAGLLFWALDGGQMEPLPRLSLAIDLAEHNIVKASASHTRFRLDVTSSCSEIAARWDEIDPPTIMMGLIGFNLRSFSDQIRRLFVPLLICHP